MSKLITKLVAWQSMPARQQGSERGAVAVEYGVLVGVVAVVLLAGATLFFTGLSAWFGDLIDLLPPN